MLEKIPEKLDILTKELFQRSMGHAFTPLRSDRSPNSVSKPLELDAFQTPEALSRRQSVKTPRSAEKLADTTMIGLGDYSSKSPTIDLKSLDIGSSLRRILESGKKAKRETHQSTEYVLQSPSTSDKSGPLHANVTKSSKKDRKPILKKEYVEFEVSSFDRKNAW